jgi:hypothetical protein
MNERLQQLLADARAAQAVDWLALRDRLFEEHATATTPADKGDCIAAWRSLMDAVERQADAGDVAKLKEARRRDYNLFVINESLVDGQVEPAKLGEITLREVTAGRMAVNHRLRILAIFSAYGLADLLSSNPELYAALTAGSD